MCNEKEALGAVRIQWVKLSPVTKVSSHTRALMLVQAVLCLNELPASELGRVPKDGPST